MLLLGICIAVAAQSFEQFFPHSPLGSCPCCDDEAQANFNAEQNIIKVDNKFRKDLKSKLIAFFSFLTSIVAAVASYTSPMPRWQHLRTSALSLESEIWAFRTRTGKYVETMHDSSSRAAERAFHKRLKEISGRSLDVSDLQLTDFFSKDNTKGDNFSKKNTTDDEVEKKKCNFMFTATTMTLFGIIAGVLVYYFLPMVEIFDDPNEIIVVTVALGFVGGCFGTFVAERCLDADDYCVGCRTKDDKTPLCCAGWQRARVRDAPSRRDEGLTNLRKSGKYITEDEVKENFSEYFRHSGSKHLCGCFGRTDDGTERDFEKLKEIYQKTLNDQTNDGKNDQDQTARRMCGEVEKKKGRAGTFFFGGIFAGGLAYCLLTVYDSDKIFDEYKEIIVVTAVVGFIGGIVGTLAVDRCCSFIKIRQKIAAATARRSYLSQLRAEVAAAAATAATDNGGSSSDAAAAAGAAAAEATTGTAAEIATAAATAATDNGGSTSDAAAASRDADKSELKASEKDMEKPSKRLLSVGDDVRKNGQEVVLCWMLCCAGWQNTLFKAMAFVICGFSAGGFANYFLTVYDGDEIFDGYEEMIVITAVVGLAGGIAGVVTIAFIDKLLGPMDAINVQQTHELLVPILESRSSWLKSKARRWFKSIMMRKWRQKIKNSLGSSKKITDKMIREKANEAKAAAKKQAEEVTEAEEAEEAEREADGGAETKHGSISSSIHETPVAKTGTNSKRRARRKSLVKVDGVGVTKELAKTTQSPDITAGGKYWCEGLTSLLDKHKDKIIIILDVPDLGEDAEGAEVIKNALSKKNSCSELILNKCVLGVKGAKHIASMIADECCKITRLEMNGCGIGDDGAIKILDAIQRNKDSCITHLDLSGDNNLTKKSASLFNKTMLLECFFLKELKVDWAFTNRVARITGIQRYKQQLYSKTEIEVLDAAKERHVQEMLLVCKKSGKPLLPMRNEDKRKKECTWCTQRKVVFVGCTCCNDHYCKGCSFMKLAKQFCEIKLLEELCHESPSLSDFDIRQQQSQVDSLSNSSNSLFERRTKALNRVINCEAAKAKAQGVGITKQDVMETFDIVPGKQFSDSEKDQEKKKKYMIKKKRVLSTADCWTQAIEIKKLKEEYKELHYDGEENPFCGGIKGVDMWKHAVAEAKDNCHSPLRPEQYVKFRLVPELDYYRRKIPDYSYWRKWIHVFTVAASLFGTVHSFLPLEWIVPDAQDKVTSLIMLLSCSSAALVAWSNFSGFEKKLKGYSAAVSKLEDTKSWWNYLSPMEKLKQENINSLVTDTELVLREEQNGWQMLESAKHLKEITNAKKLKSNDKAESLKLTTSTKSAFEKDKK